MVSAKQRDTDIELQLRRQLHARGLRYRIHQRVVSTVRSTADVVFRNAKVAIFVDGCFWHCCPLHGTMPKANGKWWAEKLAANRLRDANATSALHAAGWQVVRVWEHENPASAAANIDRIVTAARRAMRRGSSP